MNERIAIADFLAQNPHIFWALIHIGWGAVYGSILLSALFVVTLSSRHLKSHPGARSAVVVVQLCWAVPQLVGVFSIPWLIGAIDSVVLMEGYFVPYLIPSLVLTLAVYWWLFRKHFRFADIR